MFLVDMTLISKIWEIPLLLRAAWFSIFGDAPTPKHIRCLEPDLRCVCDTWLISLQYVYHQHMNAHDPNDPKKCQALASVRRASLVPRAPSRGHSLEASVEPLASRTNADCRLMAKIHYAWPRATHTNPASMDLTHVRTVQLFQQLVFPHDSQTPVIGTLDTPNYSR